MATHSLCVQAQQEWAGATADLAQLNDPDFGLPVKERISDYDIRLVNPAPPHNRWGNYGILHPDTEEEAVAMNCALHGCKKCLYLYKAPTIKGFSKWLRRGVALPKGAAGKEQHLAMFNLAYQQD